MAFIGMHLGSNAPRIELRRLLRSYVVASYLPNEAGPCLVAFPQLDPDLPLEILDVLSYPLGNAIVYDLAHELRRGHLPVGEDLVQIFQIVPSQHIGQYVGRLANVDDPVGPLDQAGGAELHVARVRGPVHPPRRTKGGMAVEAVGDHEGISHAEGEGEPFGGGGSAGAEDGRDDQEQSEGEHIVIKYSGRVLGVDTSMHSIGLLHIISGLSCKCGTGEEQTINFTHS